MTEQPGTQAHPSPKVIVHCSDLHFGRGFQEKKAQELLYRIQSLRPDALVVSGDLTMRARKGQFSAARKFLEQIHVPRLILPGNHDVPLYNIFLRMLDPFRNYERYAADLSTNPIVLDGVALFGINSVNPKRHQQGRFTHNHLHAVAHWEQSLPKTHWRIIVVHQHFVAIPGFLRPGVIPNAEKVLTELSHGGTHAVLCGHMHFKYIGSTRDFFPHIQRPMALITAGTPTCGRLRGQPDNCVHNFIVLNFYPQYFEAVPYDWTPNQQTFCPGEKAVFERSLFGEKNGSA